MDDVPTSGTAHDWTAVIGGIVRARERLHAEAPAIHPATAPHAGADDEQLAAAQRRLGHDLDPQHRALLRHVDGWEQLFVHTDLLSTDQLGAPGLWSHARDLLAYVEDDWPPGYVPPVDDVDVLGATTTGGDMFLVWRTGPVTGGGHPVLWLGSGQRVEQWANVAAMLASVLAYTRSTVEDVRARRPPVDRL